jgi:hypothetical protein
MVACHTPTRYDSSLAHASNRHAIVLSCCWRAVLLSSGQVVCLDLANAAITLQVLLGSASGDARVNSFDCDTRGNLLVAACSDGQGRLFDLAALRRAAAAGGAASRRAGQAAAAAPTRGPQSKGALVAASAAHQQQPQPLPVVEQLTLQQLEALPGYSLTPLPQQAATGGSTAEDNSQRGEGDRPALQQLSQNVGNGMAGRKAVKEAGKGGQGAAAGGASSGRASGGQLRAQRVDLPASALNRAKLEQLLKRFGVFPHQQRALIWWVEEGATPRLNACPHSEAPYCQPPSASSCVQHAWQPAACLSVTSLMHCEEMDGPFPHPCQLTLPNSYMCSPMQGRPAAPAPQLLRPCSPGGPRHTPCLPAAAIPAAGHQWQAGGAAAGGAVPVGTLVPPVW